MAHRKHRMQDMVNKVNGDKEFKHPNPKSYTVTKGDRTKKVKLKKAIKLTEKRGWKSPPRSESYNTYEGPGSDNPFLD